MRVSKRTWRIIWAIALKDIADAIRNKTALGIMIGVGFLMLSTQALAFLVKGQSEPAAVIYDQGASAQIHALVRSRTLRLGIADSFEEMVGLVSQSVEPRLGLVIPRDFDEAINAREPLEIQGYLPHWIKTATAADLVIYFEEHLGAATGAAIRIQVDGNAVYPNPEQMGFSTMVATGIVLGVMITGLILVPILLIEEKETQTLDVLLVSPAHTLHLLVGKALAGLFYALLASLVMFAFSGYWIVHWWVAFVAVILGALCAVLTGLLLGSIFENFTIVNMWAGVIIAFFLLPVFLWSSIASRLPYSVQTLAQALPSLAMFRMVVLSLSETVSLAQVWPYIAIMLGFIVLMAFLVGWRIQRADR